MLKAKQSFGLPIAGLLSQVGSNGLSPMVPNESAGGEGDPLSLLLQTPTDVYVVTRLFVLRVKAVQGQQHVTAESHVAARYVLGHLVVLEHVGRLTWTGGNATCQPAIV